MSSPRRVATGYDLPFEVRTSPAPLLSSGGLVQVVPAYIPDTARDPGLLAGILELFAGLAATGALAGSDLEPSKSSLKLSATPGPSAISSNLQFQECRVSEEALVVLVHMILAQQEKLFLRRLDLFQPGRRATLTLERDADEDSTYPGYYRGLPFTLIDEEPESGDYAFTIELWKPLEPKHGEYLEHALKRWTETILAGGYGLAPVPPQDDYVEPDDDCVTSFDTTVEWSVLKLLTDPASLNGLVNIVTSFHHRCQQVVSLTIS